MSEQQTLFEEPKKKRARVPKKEKTLKDIRREAERSNEIAAQIILASPESIELYGGEQSLMVRCCRLFRERMAKGL